jgi:hypothetical protein
LVDRISEFVPLKTVDGPLPEVVERALVAPRTVQATSFISSKFECIILSSSQPNIELASVTSASNQTSRISLGHLVSLVGLAVLSAVIPAR